MNGVIPSGNHHPGHGNRQRLGPRLHLGPGHSGTQNKRTSVLVSSQLTGTAQIKRARLRHGSRTFYGHEVIFVDPHKGIHGDENNVCL